MVTGVFRLLCAVLKGEKMTVKELIKILIDLPQDYEIYIDLDYSEAYLANKVSINDTQKWILIKTY
jgi:hypothetical protein